MKEYYDSFITKDDEYRVSVSTDKGKIRLGIDIGCDGEFVDLGKKEVNQVINMLKLASKKVN